MIITVLLLVLVFSFFIHIGFLALYVASRGKARKQLINFFISAFINFGLMIALIYVAIKMPDMVQQLNFEFILWVVSGIVMFFVLFIKILVYCRVRKRMKDSDNFHFNYFGKKVYHTSVVTKVDLAIVFISLPFFLMIGSYFIARLINLILYGHL